jgi:hypothetical protein
MIEESDIVFVTTSNDDFLLNKQQKILSELFPGSDRIVVKEGSWPYKWFKWIPLMKDRSEKYFIHLDIDFFVTSREEVIRSVEELEKNNYSLYGVSDGYDPYRGANPVALNSYYMVGKISDINELNLNPNFLYFSLYEGGWKNNLNLYFKEEYLKTFNYPHEIQENRKNPNYYYSQEPYYIIFWMLLEKGKKIGYLYSKFDERFKSSNPRIDENSPDIGIHMWYSREWRSETDVFGMKNNERYFKLFTKINGEF